MSDEMGREKGKLGMPEHIARQKLLEAPETKEIAEALGVELEAYVDRVLFYAKNPDVDPEFNVVPDEDLVEAGVDVPSVSEVTAWFEGVASGEIEIRKKTGLDEADGFGTDKPEGDLVREKAGFEVERTAPRQEELAAKPAPNKTGTGSVLAEQLRAQQSATRLSMDAQRSKPKK